MSRRSLGILQRLSRSLGFARCVPNSVLSNLFRDKAPDVLDLLLRENPIFAEEFWRQPSMKGGGAVMLSKFHHKNIVLIGDAAHAMFPTYGTGCNVALEDCFIFNNILRELTPSGLHMISCGRKLPSVKSKRRSTRKISSFIA